MPATTGVSAVPIGHPGADVQGGAVPVFFMSQAARGEARADVVPQLGAVLEPDRWLKLPGLVLGARMFGKSGDTLGEPYIGYRTKLNDRVSIGGGAYGTAKRSTAKLAAYHATRVGAEAAVDANLVQATSWLSVHAQAAVAATRIMASGSYCIGAEGQAVDCNVDDPSMNVMIDGKQTGVYPAATGTLSVASTRSNGFIRGATVSMLGSVGSMPIVRDGVKTGTGAYHGLGIMLTLGLGD
ncbi:MAG TPA: hypothetical protein VLB44_04885 [Kofleriaceae bacterium]|nr:hypothetical protein [Kofleriaceae bacterium]